MTRPETKGTIDGHVYLMRKMDPESLLRLQVHVGKLVGGTLLRAISGSEGIRGLITDLLADDSGKLEELLDAGTSSLRQFVPAILEAVGDVADDIADRLEPDRVIEAARLISRAKDVDGRPCLTAMVIGDPVDVDPDTWRDLMDQRGPWHQLKLLQAITRYQLGNSSTGSRIAQGSPAPVEATG